MPTEGSCSFGVGVEQLDMCYWEQLVGWCHWLFLKKAVKLKIFSYSFFAITWLLWRAKFRWRAGREEPLYCANLPNIWVVWTCAQQVSPENRNTYWMWSLQNEEEGIFLFLFQNLTDLPGVEAKWPCPPDLLHNLPDEGVQESKGVQLFCEWLGPRPLNQSSIEWRLCFCLFFDLVASIAK